MSTKLFDMQSVSLRLPTHAFYSLPSAVCTLHKLFELALANASEAHHCSIKCFQMHRLTLLVDYNSENLVNVTNLDVTNYLLLQSSLDIVR